MKYGYYSVYSEVFCIKVFTSNLEDQLNDLGRYYAEHISD